jgi:hypothetical protein
MKTEIDEKEVIRKVECFNKYAELMKMKSVNDIKTLLVHFYYEFQNLPKS